MAGSKFGIRQEMEAAAPATAQQFVKNVTAAGTPEQLKAAATYFMKAVVLGRKGLGPTSSAANVNTGTVRIGPAAAANLQPFELAPGDERVLLPPVGQRWNLADWYVDAVTNGDGVVVLYS